jgi:hypothetical protein
VRLLFPCRPRQGSSHGVVHRLQTEENAGADEPVCHHGVLPIMSRAMDVRNGLTTLSIGLAIGRRKEPGD